MKLSALAFALTMTTLTMTTLASVANAAPTTFFGEDVNLSGDPTTVSPTNSNAARTSFFSNLTGVGTQSFDIGGGVSPVVVLFPGAGYTTITGADIAFGNDGAGRYPVSGAGYLFADTNDLLIQFDSPVAAFGFYGVDIGDFGGQLSLTLTDSASNVTTLLVPHTLGNNASTSGSILYFGFFDTTTAYTSIKFGNDSNGQDKFAFDNLSVGTLRQVTPTPAVPEPSTWAMMILGFAGIGTITYRRRKSATRTA